MKQLSLGQQALMASRFPRQTCRGLIEAELAAAVGKEPAGFPRQTCRGLIEASRVLPLHPVRSRVSPANLPGPH